MSDPSPTTPPIASPGRRDDVAYIAPMATFLGFNYIGSTWPALYPFAYAIKTVVVAILLWMFWKHYTRVRWNFWWLGVIVGIVGVFQWVGMQLLLQKYFEFFRPGEGGFVPPDSINTPGLLIGFYVIRIVGASLVVPVMEELFWRDYLWRSIAAPNNFKLVPVGYRDGMAMLCVAGAFAFVHGNWWLTSIPWALMIAGLLWYTRSLGACIVAHGVTNLLLAGYVLYTRDWSFW